MNNIKYKNCPICGGRMLSSCPYCNFKTYASVGGNDLPSINKRVSFRNIRLKPPQSFKKHCQNLTPYYESALPSTETPTYNTDLQNLELLYSNFMLPFEEDINRFFKDRFNSLKKGGYLVLSAPIIGIFFKAAPLEGQINFFRSKNIMFLLERNGFKLIRRSMPWGSVVYLIAQKM